MRFRLALASALVATSCIASMATLTAIALHQPAADPCGLPASMTTTDSTLVARAMACRDLEYGRITRAEYAKLIGLTPPQPAPIAAVPAEPQWAASVLAFSSQWSADSWSAQNVVGAPNVYPAVGDNAKAWASRDADAPTEFIEVGFAQPMHASGLRIYETYNPGALSAVRLTTASGKTIDISPGAAGAQSGAAIDSIQFACTSEPIVSARVTINSGAVAGWNEIDAIGLVPCTR